MELWSTTLPTLLVLEDRRDSEGSIEPQSSNSVPTEEISQFRDACKKKTVHAFAIATIRHAQFVPG